MTAQLLSVITLLVLVTAPLPMIFHILRGVTARSRVPALPAEKMLVLLVLWTVLQSSVVLVLGWIGYLRLVGVLSLEAALLGSGLWLISREGGLSVDRLRRGGTLGSAWVLAPERTVVERALVSIACGVALFLSLRVITVPITDGDSLWFQLPRVAQWYQQATLTTPMDQLAGDIHNFYPYTWNTLFFLALAAAGHDQFVLLPGVLAWLTLGVGTYALGRLVGGHRVGAMFGALLVLLMPVSIAEVQTAHNDLALGAFFVASVYFTMHGWRYRQRFSLLMAVICMAMMAGTKGSGPPYIALTICLWLCLFVANWLSRKPRDWRIARSAVMTGLVAASIGLPGASWYIHNALVTANPLGNVEIAILGRVLWPGEVSQAFLNKTSLLANGSLTHPGHWELLRRAVTNGFGLPGLVVILLAIAASSQLFSHPRVRSRLLPILCLSLIGFFLYLATPGSAKWAPDAEMYSWFVQYDLRYSFPFWGLLGAIAGVAIGGRPTRTIAWGMIGLVALEAAMAASEGQLSVSTAGLVATCAALLVFFAWRPAIRRKCAQGLQRLLNRHRPRLMATMGLACVAAALVIVITVGTAAALEVRNRRQDVLFGGISRVIDDLPANTRIGFWQTLPYPLYGKRLQRDVSYLSLDAYATSDDMLRYLCAQAVDVIAVGPPNEYYDPPPARAWIARDRQHFEKLHGTDARRDVFVYRLTRSEAVGTGSGEMSASASSSERLGNCAGRPTRQ